MEKRKVIWKILLITGLLLLAMDFFVCRLILNWGFVPNSKESGEQRYAVPYLEFKGKPFALDHNEMGYRGKPIRQAPDSAFRILFFAGSTGYYGDPAIPELIRRKLAARWGKEVFVANCSVVSSNHRQHLHALVEEFMDTRADLVIFYGGYNENIQCLNYDPRPGYPFNYFYQHECPRWRLFLIRYSAILGEAEKRTGIISGMRSLRRDSFPDPEKWHRAIVSGYIQTLTDASRLTGSLIRGANGEACQFLAFYQPYQVVPAFTESHREIKKRIGSVPGGYDLSACLDSLAGTRNIRYYDLVHVSPEADSVISDKIVEAILERVDPK
jgi:hypothetical protein